MRVTDGRRRGHGHRGAALAFVALAALPLAAFGYGNDGEGDAVGPRGGGPHRRINALALVRFAAAARQDPILARYDYWPSIERYGLPPETGMFQVEGRTVVRSGAWFEGMPL